MNHIETMKQALEALGLVYVTCEWHTDDGMEAMQKASVAIATLRTAIEQAQSWSDVEKQEPAGHFLDFTYADSVGQVHAYDQFTKGQPFYTTPLATPVQEQIPVGYWHKGTGAFFKGNYLTPAQEQMREAGVLKPLVFPSAAPVQEPVLWRDELMCLLARIHRDGGHYTAKHGIRKSLDEADMKISEMNAAQPAPVQEPVAWMDDCAALLQNDVELWVDRCPHCGKPRTIPPAAQRQWIGLTDDEAEKCRRGTWQATFRAIGDLLREKNGGKA